LENHITKHDPQLRLLARLAARKHLAVGNLQAKAAEIDQITLTERRNDLVNLNKYLGSSILSGKARREGGRKEGRKEGRIDGAEVAEYNAAIPTTLTALHASLTPPLPLDTSHMRPDFSTRHRVDMAAVLLFDAINNLTTRHRIASDWDRRKYLLVHGAAFRGYLITPICVLHMMLIFIEDPSEFTFAGRRDTATALDIFCTLFHVLHFVVRLYLRHTPSDQEADAGMHAMGRFNSFKASARRKLAVGKQFTRGRTEQFELTSFLVALGMLLEVLIAVSEGHTIPRYIRCLRVIFLIGKKGDATEGDLRR
jgi:hypothetical protein